MLRVDACERLAHPFLVVLVGERVVEVVCGVPKRSTTWLLGSSRRIGSETPAGSSVSAMSSSS